MPMSNYEFGMGMDMHLPVERDYSPLLDVDPELYVDFLSGMVALTRDRARKRLLPLEVLALTRAPSTPPSTPPPPCVLLLRRHRV